MANYEATKYNFDGANLQDVEGVNTGIVLPWGDSTAPSGFLECDGSAVSRTTYATLFGIIGTTYGSGDGSTTFNVPDLSDRVIISKSPSFALGSTGGANSVAAAGNIGGSAGNTTISTPTLASHSHIGSSTRNRGPGPNNPDPEGSQQTQVRSPVTVYNIGNAGGGGAHSHPVSANFSGGTDSVLQPYSTVMYIIKT